MACPDPTTSLVPPPPPFLITPLPPSSPAVFALDPLQSVRALEMWEQSARGKIGLLVSAEAISGFNAAAARTEKSTGGSASSRNWRSSRLARVSAGGEGDEAMGAVPLEAGDFDLDEGAFLLGDARAAIVRATRVYDALVAVDAAGEGPAATSTT